MSAQNPVHALAMERIGKVLRGKWRLDRVLGIGGMAVVYEATHRNGMKGAVKVLHPESARDTDTRERFTREGYVANRVGRGAVRVLDDDVTEDDTPFLVMELLDGSSVDALAATRPGERLDVSEVVAIALGALDALARAHAAGIVHRDIKPENLFLTKDSGLRILDFGIARLREQSESLRATQTSGAMGTPAFMPPEQALAHWDEVGPHSDVYSLGATMFTLLTGMLTHEARTAQELMVAVCSRPARRLAEVGANVPPAIASVIERALAREAAGRYADASAMKEALELAASGVATTASLSSATFREAGGGLPRPPQTEGGTLVSRRPSWALPEGTPPEVVVKGGLGAAAAEAKTIAAPPPFADRRAMTATAAPVSSDSPIARRRRKWRLSAMIGVGAVCGIALGAGLFQHFRTSTDATSATASASALAGGSDPANNSSASAETPLSIAPGVSPAPTTVVVPQSEPSESAAPAASASAPSARAATSAAPRPPRSSSVPQRPPTAQPTSHGIDLSNPN